LVLGFCFCDPALQPAHSDNREDGHLPGPDVADHHLTEGLVEPVLDLAQLCFKEVYGHENTSFRMIWDCIERTKKSPV